MSHNAFHPLWLRQLRREIDYIYWSRNLDLRPPVLEITRLTRVLGHWQSETRTLGISEELIAKHPWPVTVNVLKHELAHQVCAELFGRPLAGHGPDFARACDLLGVESAFRPASGDLPDQVALAASLDQPTEEGRRFIERLDKLLALGRSGNEHEAALAMRKAGELMEKHNLVAMKSEQDRGYGYVIVELGVKRLERHLREIGALLGDYFFVRVVFTDLYDPQLDESFKCMELFGSRENMVVAEHCCHFLLERLRALYLANKAGFQSSGQRVRNSYYLGLLRGFRARLEEERAGAAAQAPGPAKPEKTLSALVVAEDRRLQDCVAARYPRLRTIQGRATQIHTDTFDAGLAEGRRLVLHKGVEEKQGNRGRLLR